MTTPSRWLGAAAALAITLAAGLLLTAADPVRAAGEKGATITVTEKDADRTVKVARGDTVLLKLAGNPTTGYTWLVAKNDKDKLQTDGKPKNEPINKDKKLVGAPSMQVFTFTAKAAGKAEVEMEYKRPFEKDKAPAKTFKFTVQID